MRNKLTAAFLTPVILFCCAVIRAQDGKLIYKREKCAACHGERGAKPAQPMYPALAGQNAVYAQNQMKAIRDGDRKDGLAITMRGFLIRLTDAELRSIAEWLATVKPKNAPPANNAALPEALVRQGRKLYAAKNCAGCHVKKNMAILPGYPRLTGLNFRYVFRQLRAFQNGSRRNNLSGMMTPVVMALTESEMRAIAVYVSSLF